MAEAFEKRDGEQMDEVVTDGAPKAEEAARMKRVADSAKVEKTIRSHVYAAMGIGIVPVPFVNFAALTGAHLNLARQLSQLYGVEFKEGIAKNIIVSVLGAGVPGLVSPMLSGAVAGLPVVGIPLAFAMKPGVNGLSTYAVGQMFVTHFARGGSFVGANLDAMKEDFASAYRGSREWLANVIRGRKAEAAQAEATGL